MDGPPWDAFLDTPTPGSCIPQLVFLAYTLISYCVLLVKGWNVLLFSDAQCLEHSFTE